MVLDHSCSAEMFSMPVLIFLLCLCPESQALLLHIRAHDLHKRTETSAVHVFAIRSLSQVVFKKMRGVGRGVHRPPHWNESEK